VLLEARIAPAQCIAAPTRDAFETDRPRRPFMKSLSIAASLLLASALAVAQGPASAPGPGAGPGMGMGMGMGPMHGWRMHRDNTPGWSLMSRAERQAHHDKMMGMKDHAECQAYMQQHHAQMADRAKERGRAMPGQPRRDACAMLKK
jgi:hypothetical protein